MIVEQGFGRPGRRRGRRQRAAGGSEPAKAFRAVFMLAFVVASPAELTLWPILSLQRSAWSASGLAARAANAGPVTRTMRQSGNTVAKVS
jgi:hypothetical protein